jgi:predicted MFS family arabinose efflux permease
MVLAVIALRGLVLSVDNPARQAFVIEIVGPERVVNAVGLNSVLVHSARITGPAIAGVIIALWGVAPCFAVNALSFVAMLIALARMDPTRISRPEPRRRRGGVRQALRYVADTPELRIPLLLMLVLGTLGFNFQVIIPLLAERSFGGAVSAYSLMMIAMGVGSIIGALLVGARAQASKGLITTAALGFGIASLLAAAAPTLPLEMAALVLLGLAAVTFAAGINSGLQLAAAPEMRGRVMALYSIVFLGSTPIGGPLTGWLGEAVSPRAGLVLAGVAALVAAAGAAVAFSRRPAVSSARLASPPRTCPATAPPCPEGRAAGTRRSASRRAARSARSRRDRAERAEA